MTWVRDGHNDYPWAMRTLGGYDLDRYPFDVARPELQTDLPRLRAGGVGAQFWSVYVDSANLGRYAVAATLEQIAFVYRLVARYPDALAHATAADDVRDVVASGRIACLMGIEGGHQIDESLDVLDAMHVLGVRYLTVTHNRNVPFADSATDQPVLGGLSEFGRLVIRRMNTLGMFVDLSDYAGCGYFPTGLPEVGGYPRLLDALRAAHWSEADLTALTHGNVSRAMHDMQSVAVAR